MPDVKCLPRDLVLDAFEAVHLVAIVLGPETIEERAKPGNQ